MRSITYTSAVLASLFLGCLGLSTFADIAAGPGTDRQERTAETPALPKSLIDLKNFVGKTRYYIGERYALKDHFIKWNGVLKLAIFNHSPASDVALGQDGFLFLTTQGSVEITQGQNRLTEAEVTEWAQTFHKLKNEFTEIGVDYTLVVGPNKHSIYPEFLPSWIDPAPSGETRTQDIVNVAQSVFGPAFLNTRQILIQARAQMVGVYLYHPSDTHWTELGAALIVHQALADMGLSLSPPEFRVEKLPRSGDLTRMIGQQGHWSASAPQLSRNWQCQDAAGNPLSIVTIDPLMPPRFSCGSPNGIDERLTVFHDSFGVSAIPYLAARFKHVDFIWGNTAEPMKARELEADHVLHVIVERRLITNTPENLLLKTASTQ